MKGELFKTIKGETHVRLSEGLLFAVLFVGAVIFFAAFLATDPEKEHVKGWDYAVESER